MATLSIEQFRDSRKWFHDGDENSGLEGPGYVYDGVCHVNYQPDGEVYFLCIENQLWESSELEELEEILYREFYLPEICGQNSGD